jgi:hypothetical protein
MLIRKKDLPHAKELKINEKQRTKKIEQQNIYSRLASQTS